MVFVNVIWGREREKALTERDTSQLSSTQSREDSCRWVEWQGRRLFTGFTLVRF